MSNFSEVLSFVGRIEPFTTEPPLTYFGEWVKQVENDLTSHQKLALELHAPEFSTRFLFKHEMDAVSARVFGWSWAQEPFEASSKLYSSRRYSGGDDLPRGCYYAVCNDESGYDNDTMKLEVDAYRNVPWSGYSFTVDTTNGARYAYQSPLKELVHKHRRSLLICLISMEGAKHRISRIPIKFQADASRNYNNQGGFQVVFALPLKITRLDVDGVLDLRTIAAQDWLVSLFRSGQLKANEIKERDGRSEVIFDDHITDFHRLLRHLLSPILGGNLTTDVIGARLRAAGINGLVFPSARATLHANYVNDKYQRTGGWCFLDLRNAKTARHLISIGKEHSDLSYIDFIRTTDFGATTSLGEKANPRDFSRTQMHSSRDLGTEDLKHMLEELPEHKRARTNDYDNYWAIRAAINEPQMTQTLQAALRDVGLNLDVSSVSYRQWQHILRTMFRYEGENVEAAKKRPPFELRIIGTSQ